MPFPMKFVIHPQLKYIDLFPQYGDIRFLTFHGDIQNLEFTFHNDFVKLQICVT